MRLEKVDSTTVNKLFRPTKLQKILEEFMNQDCPAVRCVFEYGEYANIRSAQSSYHSAIKHLGYPIKARILDGNLYLIKVDTVPNCDHCYKSDICSVYTPNGSICDAYKETE